MTDGFVTIAPFWQRIVNGILISVNLSIRNNRSFDEWFNRGLLYVGKHSNDDLPTPLNHAENWRFFFFKRASAPNPFETVAPSNAPFFLTASGLPLCPAVT